MGYVIRHTTSADAEALVQLYSDETAYSGTLQLPLPSLEGWKARVAQTDGVRIVACSGSDVVGHGGLHSNANPRRAHAAAIGMAVASPWQGKGVGTALLAALVDLADNCTASRGSSSRSTPTTRRRSACTGSSGSRSRGRTAPRRCVAERSSTRVDGADPSTTQPVIR